jgi:N-acetylglucosamine PTS system EIICBA or EIICB component
VILKFTALQPLGRALMLPIAVLPIAGLLLRCGQPDMLDWRAMAAAGDAIFSNLGVLFTVGVAVGLARENHGASALAALVCYLVTTHGAAAMMSVPATALAGLEGEARAAAEEAFKAHELVKLSVPVGLLCGITAGFLYNRLSNVTLPAYLSFFGGRRFVAIAAGLAGIAYASALGAAWPSLEQGMDAMSRGILGAGSIGLFAYGVLNRVLIITGLHHILNNLAWFILGDYHGATGDLKRFFAGDPTAGAFMSGFFPVLMFGLPGACLAMYRSAPPERRAAVAGLLGSLALTTFLTGVTEPVEFTFMFLAPLLYAFHAVATGLAMVLMDLFHIRLGFSFSAGFFDYVLNFSHDQRPLWLLPIGVLYFLMYYAVFRYGISRFQLATPGREPEEQIAPAARVVADGDAASAFIAALGGAQNLREVAACTTRLRLVVNDAHAVDDAALRRLGATGTVRPSPHDLQVVLGPIADQVAEQVRHALRAPGAPVTRAHDPQAVLRGLGGRSNIVDIATAPGRLLLQLADVERLDEQALAPAVRGIAKLSGGRVHLLVTGPADELAAAIRSLMGASGASG